MISGHHKDLDQQWREAKTKGGEVSNDVKEKTQSLSDQLSEMKAASVDEGKGWSKAFADRAHEMWDGLKGYTQAATDQVTDGGITESIGNAYQGTKDALGNVIHGTKDTISDYSEATANKVSETYNAAKDKVKQTVQ